MIAAVKDILAVSKAEIRLFPVAISNTDTRLEGFHQVLAFWFFYSWAGTEQCDNNVFARNVGIQAHLLPLGHFFGVRISVADQ